jgi:hypothetical protein
MFGNYIGKIGGKIGDRPGKIGDRPRLNWYWFK